MAPRRRKYQEEQTLLLLMPGCGLAILAFSILIAIGMPVVILPSMNIASIPTTVVAFPTDTTTLTPTPSPTRFSAPTNTPMISPALSATPTITATRTLTRTPTPTPTLSPFEGIYLDISATIDGTTFYEVHFSNPTLEKQRDQYTYTWGLNLPAGDQCRDAPFSKNSPQPWQAKWAHPGCNHSPNEKVAALVRRNPSGPDRSLLGPAEGPARGAPAP